jgi:hypothetical protein
MALCGDFRRGQDINLAEALEGRPDCIAADAGALRWAGPKPRDSAPRFARESRDVVRKNAKVGPEFGPTSALLAAFPQECMGQLPSSGPT